MPTAVKTPGATGTSTRRMSRAAATSHACAGPLPPKATSVKSRGSRPRSMVTARIARAMLALATSRIPRAASIDREPERRGDVALDRLARERGAASFSSPPARRSGSR